LGLGRSLSLSLSCLLLVALLDVGIRSLSDIQGLALTAE
jgi:hypothetical protein